MYRLISYGYDNIVDRIEEDEDYYTLANIAIDICGSGCKFSDDPNGDGKIVVGDGYVRIYPITE